MKKNITIDNLAIMVHKEFEESTKNVNKRFEGVDKRLDKMEKKLDKIVVNHGERIEKLEGDVKELKSLLV
ncbi:MAG TPA: hypothetical protein PLD14_00030 [Candidatus Pacearchaeota archaeon]|nr:hypothetical protein [Candidatus Pacearchaeota archaeon]HPR79602.1 hypothetical protein [Candidatus Pacearchaeota archaeon]